MPDWYADPETSKSQAEAAHIESINQKKLAEEAEVKGNPRMATLHRSTSVVAEIKEDKIRINAGQRVESEEGTKAMEEEIKENDHMRLERFKEWAKKNLAGLSAVAILVAGIITTVVVAGRSAVKKGAQAMGSFAKAVANVGKKLWPILGTVLSIIGTILSIGAKGLEFLSKNLWILAIALAYFLYDQYKQRRRR